jgi:hypothetical protein
LSVATTLVRTVGENTRKAFINGLLERLFLDGHAPAGSLRNFREFVVEPIARRADAALRITLRGKRVARAEGNERADRALDVARLDFGNDARDFRIENARSSREVVTDALRSILSCRARRRVCASLDDEQKAMSSNAKKTAKVAADTRTVND